MGNLLAVESWENTSTGKFPKRIPIRKSFRTGGRATDIGNAKDGSPKVPVPVLLLAHCGAAVRARALARVREAAG